MGVIVALKKLHLNFQLPNNKGSWNINIRRYRNREKAHGHKSGAFNVAFMDDGVGGEGCWLCSISIYVSNGKNLCFWIWLVFLVPNLR